MRNTRKCSIFRLGTLLQLDRVEIVPFTIMFGQVNSPAVPATMSFRENASFSENLTTILSFGTHLCEQKHCISNYCSFLFARKIARSHFEG